MFRDRTPLTPAYLRDKARDNRQWATEYRRARMPEVAAECDARARDFEREATRLEQSPTESLGSAIGAFVGFALVLTALAGFWIGSPA